MLEFITNNQNLLIVAILALVYILNKLIDYKAKANPAHDRWDDWQPTSQAVTDMVFKGAEMWGRLKAQGGDAKLSEYLRVLREFEANWSVNRMEAIQKLIAWYSAIKIKAISANPSIGPDDPAQ
jgi:hypothetical protein